jgi:predicted site-specific integrase-resolvase
VTAAPGPDGLLTSPEVGRRFRVDPKTVARWLAAGKFPGAFKTPGGHWRVPSGDVDALLPPGQRREVAP